MAKKILDLSSLSSFLDNIKETFALISHGHSVNDLTDYTVDSSFSSTSENPIQNKTVNNALLTIANDLDEIDEKLGTVNIADIDYETLLAFDTTEIVFESSSTTSVLGQAILGQMILA